jgi:transmembrane sensor
MIRKEIDGLIPGYLSGELSDSDRVSFEEWRKEDPANEKQFKEIKAIWEAFPKLSAMEQFDPFSALKQVNTKIEKRTPAYWLQQFQKIAAILLLPLLVFAAYQGYKYFVTPSQELVWQTYTTPPGVKAKFQLPDGSSFWLNSSSEATFPNQFAKNHRTVKVKGEAFFEVAHNPSSPFYVELSGISVKVLGTKFNVVDYENENRTEVILKEGKVALGIHENNRFKEVIQLNPNEAAFFNKDSKKLEKRRVETDKYTSWIDGNLIFRDDTMDDVIRKLNRSFNVEIKVSDPEVLKYVFTATFQDESLEQILNLLAISSPIEYESIPREKQDGNLYDKQQFMIIKR